MKQKIELVKSRDFGEIINDTFNFIFQNFKPLLVCFFTFCGFFMIGTVVTKTLQQTQMMDTLNSISSASSPGAAERVTPFSYLNWQYVLLEVVFILIAHTIMCIMVYSYLALYKEKGNLAPTLDEIWGYIKYYFFRVLGAQFLLWLLLCLGMMICLTGVWLLPIFALVIPIIIFENASFGFAFNKAFNLIKDNWWVTFGSLVVIVIISWLLAVVVTLPASAANVISTLFYHKQATKGSVAGVAFSTILQQLSMVFSIVVYVGAGLCYFNLSEIKEGTGILGRIEGFGKNMPDTNLPAEEY